MGLKLLDFPRVAVTYPIGYGILLISALKSVRLYGSTIVISLYFYHNIKLNRVFPTSDLIPKSGILFKAPHFTLVFLELLCQ